VRKLFGILLVVALVLSFSLVATTPVVASPADWYVDASADPGGDGSQGEPFQTIGEAITAAGPGDTIHVYPGIYTEAAAPGTTAVLINVPDLTLQAVDEDGVVIDAAEHFESPLVTIDAGEANIGIRATAENLGTVTIEGFTVVNYSDGGILGGRTGTTVHVLRNYVLPPETTSRQPIQVAGPSPQVIGNRVKAAYLDSENWAAAGILVIDAENALVQGNVVYGNDLADFGIAIGNYWDGAVFGGISEVVGNTVHDNVVSGCSHGIVLQGPGGDIGDTIITSNELKDNYWGIDVQTHSGDVGALTITGNELEGNVFGLAFYDWGDEHEVTVDEIESNTFTNNDVQVDDAAYTDIGLESILADNDFDRAVVVRGSAIKVPTIFSSIQEAIDVASDGDTVEVSPGTYLGRIDIDVPNLTLRSTDGWDETIIDADEATMGVWILKDLGDVTVQGFTVRNWKFGGIVQSMGNSDGTATHVLDNFSTPLPVGPTGHGNSIQVSGDGSTVIGNVVEVRHYPHLGTDSPTGILNIGASDVIISGNRVYGVEGGHEEGGTYGIAVGGHEGHGWGIAMDNTVKGNTVEGMRKAGITAWASVVDTSIFSNVLSGNEVGVLNYERDGYAPAGTVVSFNNIVDNIEWGVLNEANPTIVDATHNWWGDASGPSGEGDGDGDSVGPNINFTPWLGAAITDQPTGCTADRATGADAKAETANVSADATSGDYTTTVTVAEFVGEPTGVDPGLQVGAFFFDVHVGGELPDELEVRAACPGGECSGMVLKWFDGTEWLEVSPVSYTNGEVVAELNNVDSSPLISELTGTPFGLGNPTPPPPPVTVGWEGSAVNKAAVMAPWIALFAAMIAGATLVAVRRRGVRI